MSGKLIGIHFFALWNMNVLKNYEPVNSSCFNRTSPLTVLCSLSIHRFMCLMYTQLLRLNTTFECLKNENYFFYRILHWLSFWRLVIEVSRSLLVCVCLLFVQTFTLCREWSMILNFDLRIKMGGSVCKPYPLMTWR